MLSERAKIRLELEQKLNQFKYEGVPCGNILSYYLTLIFDKNRLFTKGSILNRTLRILRINGFLNLKYLKYPQKSKSILIVPSSTSQKIMELFDPILLDDSIRYTIIQENKNEKWKDQIISKFSYLFRSNIEHKKCWKEVYPLINQYLIREGIDPKQLLLIKYFFFIQLLRVNHYKPMIMSSNFIGVLTDHDRQPLSSVIISLANQNNIPTYTLVHGSIYPSDSYIPIISSYCFCWGQEQVDVFCKDGTEPNKLIIAGNPKELHSINTAALKTELLNRLRIDHSKKIITYGSNKVNYRFQIAQELSKAFEILDNDFHFIIKLHPLEKKEDYNFVSQKYRCVQFISEEIDINELMLISDMIIVNNSILGMDALLRQVPVLVFTYKDEYSGFGEVLKIKANAPNFTSHIEVIKFLQKFDFSDLKNSKWYLDELKFAKKYCLYFGRVSAIKILNFIKQIERIY